MKKSKETRTVAYFKNTCNRCFHDIEIPLLGDFAYGEAIFQSEDGKDFFVANFIGNVSFNFIVKYLNSEFKSNVPSFDQETILRLVADKPAGKSFAKTYPICPICKSRLGSYNDNVRTKIVELPFATWNLFEELSISEKIDFIRSAIFVEE